MKYKVFRSLYEDSRKGEVTTTFISNTRLISIKSLAYLPVVVSHREMSDSFIIRYNKSAETRKIVKDEDVVVIPDYYRKKLNIGLTNIVPLNIKRVRWYYIHLQILYLICHVDDSVRIGFWAASIIAIITTIIGLCNSSVEITNNYFFR